MIAPLGGIKGFDGTWNGTVDLRVEFDDQIPTRIAQIQMTGEKMMQVMQIEKGGQRAALELPDENRMEPLSPLTNIFKPHEIRPPNSRKQLDNFDEWFSRSHNALQYVAHRILGDYLMVERAVQNCWLRASRNPPRFECEGAFRSWLLRLLIGEALSVLHQDRTEWLVKNTGEFRNK